MGGKDSKINLDQVCSSTFEQNYTLPGFCSLRGSHNGTRDTFCKKIGKDSKEWVFSREGSGCQYDDCNETNQLNKCKSSGGCCPIAGAKNVCKRIAFNADPLTCCLQDFDNIGTSALCFISNDTVDTCNPSYRSLSSAAPPLSGTGPSCRDLLFDHCTVLDISRWDGPNSDCVRAIDRNLFGANRQNLSISSGVPVTESSNFTDASGIVWSRSVISELTKNIYANDQALGVQPGSNFQSEFEPIILKACLTSPGICDDALTNTVCANENESSIVLNPFRITYCGCYLNESAYAKYINQFQVTKECTGLCNRKGNIGLVAADGATLLPCRQSVCIIDNVNVSLTGAQSQIGNVTFSQVCGNCGSNTSTCQCIISDETIISSGTIGNINIRQDCGSIVDACTDANGDVTNCDTGEPLARAPDVPIDVGTDFTFNSMTIIIAVIIAIILFLAIIIEVILKNR